MPTFHASIPTPTTTTVRSSDGDGAAKHTTSDTSATAVPSSPTRVTRSASTPSDALSSETAIAHTLTRWSEPDVTAKSLVSCSVALAGAASSTAPVIVAAWARGMRRVLVSGGSLLSVVAWCRRVKAMALSSPAVRRRVVVWERAMWARDLMVLWWSLVREIKVRGRGSDGSASEGAVVGDGRGQKAM